MPEPPDFEQIAALVVNDPAFSQHARLLIAIRLNQVWNARGAADLETLEPIIEKLGDTMDPDNARLFVTDAILESDADA